jgi:putative sigma-54 modulation protein
MTKLPTKIAAIVLVWASVTVSDFLPRDIAACRCNYGVIFAALNLRFLRSKRSAIFAFISNQNLLACEFPTEQESRMKPTIVAKGVKLSRTLREYVARRLRFALNRTQHSIHNVTVRISDRNGPKGGIDKHCQIHLTLPGLPNVIVTEKGKDIAAAIDRASHRAALAAARLLSKAKAISHAKHPAVMLEPGLT